MASLRSIFNLTPREINAVGGLLGPLNRIFQILKEKGGTGRVFHIKDRLGARVRLLIIILLIILPPVLVLLYIKTYAVNVSVWDDLTFVPLFDKVYTGDLSFSDLFAQHAEHRILFPRLAMLSLGVITHHNTVIESYFSWFLLCLTGCVLFLAHKRQFGTWKIALVTFIPVVWLIFHLRQTTNLLSGFQMPFFMLILFFVLAIYLLATSRGLSWRFALAVASGVVCTFSMANGLLVWPIGLILILWLRKSQPKELRRTYLNMVYIWCLAGIVVFTSYFIGYEQVGAYKWDYGILNPLTSLSFFLALIGNLAYYQGVAIVTGLILLVLYIYTGGTIVWKTKARPTNALALSLILFALLSFALMAETRSVKGVDFALSSRFTTIASIGIVGLYLGIISLEIKYVNVKRFLLGFMTFFIIMAVGFSYAWGIQEGMNPYNGPGWKDQMELNAYYVSTYTVQSNVILNGLSYVGWPGVRKGAEVLEKHNLNVFSKPPLETEGLVLAEDATLSSVEKVNFWPLPQQGTPIIINSWQTATIYISGWAVDENAGQAAGGVFINVDGQMDIPTLYNLDRQDIAGFLSNSGYRYSGFTASFATSLIGEGQHILTLKIVTADKKGYYQSSHEIILEVR